MVEALILVVAVQGSSLGTNTSTAAEVAAAFLITCVLTMLPMFGVGIFEAAVIALLTVGAGSADANELAAALIIWRAATMLVPLAIGLPTLAAWRRAGHRTPLTEDSRLGSSG